MDNALHYGWNQDAGCSLLAKLKTDLKRAMLERNQVVRDAIRVIMSEFPKITVPITLESGKKTSRPKREEEITDDEIITVIRGLIKSEQTTLELQGLDSSPYLETLRSYLPAMAPAEEIDAWIRGHIDFSRFKSPMQAMGEIMKHFGKRADGKLVRELLEAAAADLDRP